ncbi:MAG: hypothetical protein PUB18_01815 [bacterium]|nr:hypothetical protein [bacterium]
MKKNSEKLVAIAKFGLDDSYGDGWHDNFAYGQAIQKENVLFYPYQKQLERFNSIEIVKRKINSGKVVTLEAELENECYKIIGDTASLIE